MTDSLLACATLVISSDEFYQVHTTLSPTRVAGDFYGFQKMALFPMALWVTGKISESFGVVCMLQLLMHHQSVLGVWIMLMQHYKMKSKLNVFLTFGITAIFLNKLFSILLQIRDIHPKNTLIGKFWSKLSSELSENCLQKKKLWITLMRKTTLVVIYQHHSSRSDVDRRDKMFISHFENCSDRKACKNNNSINKESLREIIRL